MCVSDVMHRYDELEAISVSETLSHLEESEKKDVSATDKDKPDVTSSDDQAESSNNEKKPIGMSQLLLLITTLSVV